MFYKKIDLRKLYEQADLNTEAGEEVASEAPQAAESFPKSDPEQEAINVMKGNTYAFPIGEEDYNQLTELIKSGSGEWNSSAPLKTINNPNSDAMLKIGGQEKPVYLKIILVKTKGERLSAPLNLEEDDRFYVALMASPEGLKSNIDTAADISNYVKVSVKTPLMKGGKNVEHSLNMWKNFESMEEDQEDETLDVEEIQANQPGLAAQLDLPESRKRFVGGKWKPINEAIKMVKSESGGNDRWLYDETTKKAYPVSGPQKYKELATKYGISTKAVAMPKSEIDAAMDSAISSAFSKNDALGAGYVLPEVEVTAKKAAPSTGFSQEEGDKFRQWANSTEELKKKYGKTSKFDLDAAGKPDNSFIRKSYAAAKAEYEASKEAKAKADAEAKAKADADAKAKADADANQAQTDPDEAGLDAMNPEQLKAELDKSKQELKSAKQGFKQSKKENKLIKKIQKIEKKIEKKTQRKAANESKIYNFDEFVKAIHGLQSSKFNKPKK